MENSSKNPNLPLQARRNGPTKAQSFLIGFKNSKFVKVMNYVHAVAYHSLIVYCFYTLGPSRPFRDYSLLFLSLLLNYGFTLIDYLVEAYRRLPRNEKSRRKSLLNFAIWLTSSGILCGIVFPFAPYFNIYAAVPLYFIAIGGSAFLLYLNLKRNDGNDVHPDDDDDCCDNV